MTGLSAPATPPEREPAAHTARRQVDHTGMILAEIMEARLVR